MTEYLMDGCGQCDDQLTLKATVEFPEITTHWCPRLDRRMYVDEGGMVTDSLENLVYEARQKVHEDQGKLWTEYNGNTP